MSVAELLFDVMGPVVVVVAVGWVAGRSKPFDVQTLSTLAFWVLGPAFAFDVFAGAELARDTVGALVVAALAGMAVAALVGAALARVAAFETVRRNAVMMTSAYGNVGNAGLAISVFAFGDDVAPVAALLMIVINMTGMTMGVALGSLRTHGIRPAIQRSMTAPMTLAAGLALVVNLTGWDPPLVADRSIALVAGALIPTMLLTLGMQLAQNGAPRPELDMGVTGVAKLVVTPTVAWAVGTAFGLEDETLGVLVLQSAMPPAVFCAVVALEYDLEPARVGRTVVGTTLLALLTLPVALIAVT